MQGIVTLVEGTARDRIAALWEMFEADLGIRFAFPGSEPHLSFHVAQRVDVGRSTAAMAKLAAATAPFESRTSGLGVFPGANPVVFLGLVPSRRLADFQRAVHVRMSGLSQGFVSEYAPERWVPHITVARENIPPERLGEALAWWARKDLAFPVRVDHVAVAAEAPAGVDVLERFALGPRRR